jgi:hypothetical protein
LVAALATLPGLGIGTLWDNSETAYGEVAREILIYHDPIVLHLNGQPWFVQPPSALCSAPRAFLVTSRTRPEPVAPGRTRRRLATVDNDVLYVYDGAPCHSPTGHK